jgi:hypothetical protein
MWKMHGLCQFVRQGPPWIPLRARRGLVQQGTAPCRPPARAPVPVFRDLTGRRRFARFAQLSSLGDKPCRRLYDVSVAMLWRFLLAPVGRRCRRGCPGPDPGRTRRFGSASSQGQAKSPGPGTRRGDERRDRDTASPPDFPSPATREKVMRGSGSASSHGEAKSPGPGLRRDDKRWDRHTTSPPIFLLPQRGRRCRRRMSGS